MKEIMIEAFWLTAGQLTELVVPVTALIIIIDLFLVALFGGSKRV